MIIYYQDDDNKVISTAGREQLQSEETIKEKHGYKWKITKEVNTNTAGTPTSKKVLNKEGDVNSIIISFLMHKFQQSQTRCLIS